MNDEQFMFRVSPEPDGLVTVRLTFPRDRDAAETLEAVRAYLTELSFFDRLDTWEKIMKHQGTSLQAVEHDGVAS